MKRLNLFIFGWTLCLTVLAADMLSAQTYFDYIIGKKRDSFNARSMALGHTGAVSSYRASAIMTNPALLWQGFAPGAAPHQVLVDASYVALRPSENRSFPLLDTFGDVITETIYATNSPLYYNTDIGALYKFNDHLYFGAGSFAYYTFYYDYKERLSAQLPSSAVNRDPFLDNQISYGNGTWRTYSLSVSTHWMEQIGFGATLNYITGSGFRDHYRYSLLKTDYSGIHNTIDYRNRTNGGRSMNLILGASYQVTPHILLGASMTMPWSIKTKGNIFYPGMDTTLVLPRHFADTTGSYGNPVPLDIKHSQPVQVSLGVEYRPKNELFSRFIVDVNFTNWKSYKQTFSRAVPVQGDTVNAFRPPFKDVWDIHVGVEHILFGSVPLRYGFSHIGSPMNNALTTTAFSIGTGKEWDAFKFDAAIEIANRDYKYLILFPQTAADRSSLDRVEESTVSFQFSVCYRFGFVK